MKKTLSPSPAYDKFIGSMQLSYDDWHDGNSYDLDALEEIPESQRDAAVKVLADHLEKHPDWRDVEALAVLDTPEARKAIRKAVKDADLETRMHAAEQLIELGEKSDLEGTIIDALRNTGLGSGLSQAIDMAEEHPSPRIQETLLDLALNGTEEQRIHCAALALYLGGKADEAFDWNHRPFFLSFGDEDRNKQIEAYKELCRRLGVKPKVK
jgi:hypothetical protein